LKLTPLKQREFYYISTKPEFVGVLPSTIYSSDLCDNCNKFFVLTKTFEWFALCSNCDIPDTVERFKKKQTVKDIIE
jgi:hypothetical protein